MKDVKEKNINHVGGKAGKTKHDWGGRNGVAIVAIEVAKGRAIKVKHQQKI
jgi:hypothetical protein